MWEGLGVYQLALYNAIAMRPASQFKLKKLRNYMYADDL